MGARSLSVAVGRLGVVERLVEIQETVRTAARQVVLADGATFVLRDGDECFYADEDAMSPLWKGQRFPLTRCISGWAMLNDEVAIVPDITQDERIPLEAYRPTFVKSLVMVPVGRGGPAAAIGAYWARVHAATLREVEMLEELADATAAAITRIGLDDAPFTPASLRSRESATRP
ncbi:MAG: GAF domain-containing protein [Acidimicrobiia bacterium]|nr:GAF domain-containing protein [Acidimicrobiia bacterium]